MMARDWHTTYSSERRLFFDFWYRLMEDCQGVKADVKWNIMTDPTVQL